MECLMGRVVSLARKHLIDTRQFRIIINFHGHEISLALIEIQGSLLN
jgi:hypothetical protein